MQRYRRKLSGPLLDRIDLHVELQPVGPRELLIAAPGEPSASVRERVLRARQRQDAREQQGPNARLGPRALETHATLADDARDLLYQAVEEHGLTGRVTTRVLKVSRTIADLAGAEGIASKHVAEALAYRPLDVVS